MTDINSINSTPPNSTNVIDPATDSSDLISGSFENQIADLPIDSTDGSLPVTDEFSHDFDLLRNTYLLNTFIANPGGNDPQATSKLTSGFVFESYQEIWDTFVGIGEIIGGEDRGAGVGRLFDANMLMFQVKFFEVEELFRLLQALVQEGLAPEQHFNNVMERVLDMVKRVTETHEQVLGRTPGDGSAIIDPLRWFRIQLAIPSTGEFGRDFSLYDIPWDKVELGLAFVAPIPSIPENPFIIVGNVRGDLLDGDLNPVNSDLFGRVYMETPAAVDTLILGNTTNAEIRFGTGFKYDFRDISFSDLGDGPLRAQYDLPDGRQIEFPEEFATFLYIMLDLMGIEQNSIPASQMPSAIDLLDLGIDALNEVAEELFGINVDSLINQELPEPIENVLNGTLEQAVRVGDIAGDLLSFYDATVNSNFIAHGLWLQWLANPLNLARFRDGLVGLVAPFLTSSGGASVDEQYAGMALGFLGLGPDNVDYWSEEQKYVFVDMASDAYTRYRRGIITTEEYMGLLLETAKEVSDLGIGFFEGGYPNPENYIDALTIDYILSAPTIQWPKFVIPQLIDDGADPLALMFSALIEYNIALGNHPPGEDRPHDSVADRKIIHNMSAMGLVSDDLRQQVAEVIIRGLASDGSTGNVEIRFADLRDRLFSPGFNNLGEAIDDFLGLFSEDIATEKADRIAKMLLRLDVDLNFGSDYLADLINSNLDNNPEFQNFTASPDISKVAEAFDWNNEGRFFLKPHQPNPQSDFDSVAELIDPDQIMSFNPGQNVEWREYLESEIGMVNTEIMDYETSFIANIQPLSDIVGYDYSEQLQLARVSPSLQPIGAIPTIDGTAYDMVLNDGSIVSHIDGIRKILSPSTSEILYSVGYSPEDGYGSLTTFHENGTFTTELLQNTDPGLLASLNIDPGETYIAVTSPFDISPPERDPSPTTPNPFITDQGFTALQFPDLDKDPDNAEELALPEEWVAVKGSPELITGNGRLSDDEESARYSYVVSGLNAAEVDNGEVALLLSEYNTNYEEALEVTIDVTPHMTHRIPILWQKVEVTNEANPDEEKFSGGALGVSVDGHVTTFNDFEDYQDHNQWVPTEALEDDWKITYITINSPNDKVKIQFFNDVQSSAQAGHNRGAIVVDTTRLRMLEETNGPAGATYTDAAGIWHEHKPDKGWEIATGTPDMVNSGEAPPMELLSDNPSPYDIHGDETASAVSLTSVPSNETEDGQDYIEGIKTTFTITEDEVGKPQLIPFAIAANGHQAETSSGEVIVYFGGSAEVTIRKDGENLYNEIFDTYQEVSANPYSWSEKEAIFTPAVAGEYEFIITSTVKDLSDFDPSMFEPNAPGGEDLYYIPSPGIEDPNELLLSDLLGAKRGQILVDFPAESGIKPPEIVTYNPPIRGGSTPGGGYYSSTWYGPMTSAGRGVVIFNPSENYTPPDYISPSTEIVYQLDIAAQEYLPYFSINEEGEITVDLESLPPETDITGNVNVVDPTTGDIIDTIPININVQPDSNPLDISGTAAPINEVSVEELQTGDPVVITDLTLSNAFLADNAIEPSDIIFEIQDVQDATNFQIDDSGQLIFKPDETIQLEPGTSQTVVVMIFDAGNPSVAIAQVSFNVDLVEEVGGQDAGGSDPVTDPDPVVGPEPSINQPPTDVTLRLAIPGLSEDADTTNPIKVADIFVADDGLGENTLVVLDDPEGNFEIVGNELFFVGTNINFANNSHYLVRVGANDESVGETLDVVSEILRIDVFDPNAVSRNKVLLLTEALSLSPEQKIDDDLLFERLTGLGFDVIRQFSGDLNETDLSSVDLVVASGHIYNNEVSTLFDNVDVPVVAVTGAVLDELHMRGDVENPNAFTITTDTDIPITTPNHPIALGLQGNIEIFNDDPNAYLVELSPDGEYAQIAENHIYAYEEGALLGNGQASPDRRVAFLGNHRGISGLTPDALQLLDNAFLWALGQPTKIINSSQNLMPSDVIFNEDFYLTTYPDVAAAVTSNAFTSGLDHFVKVGFAEGRLGTPVFQFDETYYLTTYSDVAAAVTNGAFSSGFEHFIRYGGAESRSPNTEFDNLSEIYNEQTYLTYYPDVATAVVNGAIPSGFYHYINFGILEERQTT